MLIIMYVVESYTSIDLKNTYLCKKIENGNISGIKLDIIILSRTFIT